MRSLALFAALLLAPAAGAQPMLGWSASYNGPNNHDDSAAFVAADPDGSIIATGWTCDGPDSATSHTITIKFSPTGAPLWQRRFQAPAHDEPVGLALDGAGNACVLVRYFDPDSDFTSVIIKYSPSGDELWRRTLAPFTARALAIDGLGNLCVTGISEYGFGYATLKYDPDGNQQWSRFFMGPGGGDDQPSAITADHDGNVFVTGKAWRECCVVSDMATIKYDADGTLAWTAWFRDAPTTGQPVAIALDPAGNVLLAAYTSSNPRSSPAFTTIKYDPSGQEQWVRRYSGPLNHAVPVALAVDDHANIYVGGWSASPPNAIDRAVVKYDPLGNQLWARRSSAAGNDRYYLSAMALDPSGGVVITGTQGAYATNDDVLTMKYDADGNAAWSRTYARPATAYNWPSSIALDRAGNTIVAGGAGANTPQWRDWLLLKYCAPRACTPDFDGDGVDGTDADIEAFFACLAGNCPPTCVTADFNADGDVATDADIEAFFRVLAGGNC